MYVRVCVVYEEALCMREKESMYVCMREKESMYVNIYLLVSMCSCTSAGAEIARAASASSYKRFWVSVFVRLRISQG